MSTPSTYPEGWSEGDLWTFVGVLIVFGVAFIVLVIVDIVFQTRYIPKYKRFKRFLQACPAVSPREFFEREKNIRSNIADHLDAMLKTSEGQRELAEYQTKRLNELRLT